MVFDLCKMLLYTLFIGNIKTFQYVKGSSTETNSGISGILGSNIVDGDYPYVVNTHYKLSAYGYGPNYLGSRDSLRFSTAFDKNFRIYKNFFNDHNDANSSFYESCIELCDSYDHCNGIFYNLGDNSHCIGLSYLGKLSETETRSFSLTKVRIHKIHTHEHAISGFVRNQGQFDNQSHVYLDINLNGELDKEEPIYKTESDGFYEFNNLSFFNYVLRQHNSTGMTFYNCSQVFPNEDGNVIDFLNNSHQLYNDGFPDVVIEYKDSGNGVMGGGDGGDPHGGRINDLLNNEGTSIKDTLTAISGNVILGNNTEYALILSKNSYIIVGFTSENILINNTFSLQVEILYELNSLDTLSVYVSENNEDYVYVGMVTETKNRFVLNHLSEVITVLRYVKLMARTGDGNVKGVPLINVFVNHTDVGLVSWAHNIYLPHNKSENADNVNFTNLCYIPDPTTTTTTPTTTTTTTTTTTPTTTTTTTTTPTTTTTTTTTTTPTTTTTTTTTTSEKEKEVKNTSQTSNNATSNNVTSNSFNLLFLIPIIAGSIIFTILMYVFIDWIRRKNEKHRRQRIESAKQQLELSSRQTYNNPLYVPMTPPVSFNERVQMLPSKNNNESSL